MVRPYMADYPRFISKNNFNSVNHGQVNSLTRQRPRTVHTPLADSLLVPPRCMSNAQNLDVTYPHRPRMSARALLSPKHLLFSLFPSPFTQTSLSLTPSHGGTPPSSPPLKPLRLAEASPDEAGVHRRAAPPRHIILPWT